jgi:hypothetical protein
MPAFTFRGTGTLWGSSSFMKSIAAHGIEATRIELQCLWSVNVISEIRKRPARQQNQFTCGAAHQMKRRHI